MAPTSSSAARVAADVAAARLDAFESQVVFRALLDTVARPGTVRRLPAELVQRVPTPLLAPLALADVDTPIAVLGAPTYTSGDDTGRAAGSWAEVAREATGAPLVDVAAAALIACLDPDGTDIASVVDAAERGDAFTPERGAKVALPCRALRPVEPGDPIGPDADGCLLRLTGPGVDGNTTLDVKGFDRRVVEAIVRANRSFPAGIDVWLCADDGHLVGLPRTTRIVLVSPADEPHDATTTGITTATSTERAH
jgi:alpha-D-ribose 1-methylphosphonate 5-triphosphate synthase subunit PhnH